MSPVEYPVVAGSARFDGTRLGVIAGPCVVEDAGLVLEVATELKRLTQNHGLPFVFKCSYAKDNRTSLRSYRGPGREQGLAILTEVAQKLDLCLLTDVHTAEDVPPVAEAVDVLQIPAFLCRQTSLLEAAGATGKPVNIKKGQFLAPGDMIKAVEKVREAGSDQVMVTERGATFGYNNLVVDMRSIPILAETTGCPVIYDATHSLQLPGGGEVTGGQRQYAPPLARAAVAAGAHAVFFETHPNPDEALSDPATQLPLASIPDFLRSLLKIWGAVHDGEK